MPAEGAEGPLWVEACPLGPALLAHLVAAAEHHVGMTARLLNTCTHICTSKHVGNLKLEPAVGSNKRQSHNVGIV